MVPGPDLIRRGRSAHRGRWAVAFACALVMGVAACTTSSDGGAHPSVAPSPTPSFDPAQSSRYFPPAGGHAGTTPVVVLVPGGGWASADPTGLSGLATWLSQRGAAVVTVTYRTSSDGAYFPVPAQDVACDVADAVARTIVAPAELPIGIITAAVGGPFFLWILLRRRSIIDL